MASSDMRLFMRQDFSSALFHIDAGDNNIFHPTERRDGQVGHDKPRTIFQYGPLARTYQTHDLADGIEEPSCKKEASADVDHKQGRQPRRKATLFFHRSSAHLQEPFEFQRRTLYGDRLIGGKLYKRNRD